MYRRWCNVIRKRPSPVSLIFRFNIFSFFVSHFFWDVHIRTLAVQLGRMKTVQCVDCVRAKLQIAWWRISIMIFFLWYFLPPPPTHSRRIEHEKYKNYVHSFFSFSFSFVNCQEEEEEEKKLSKLRCVCAVGLDCDETWPVSWHWWRTLVVLIIYTLIQSAAAFKNSLFIFSFFLNKKQNK